MELPSSKRGSSAKPSRSNRKNTRQTGDGLNFGESSTKKKTTKSVCRDRSGPRKISTELTNRLGRQRTGRRPSMRTFEDTSPVRERRHETDFGYRGRGSVPTSGKSTRGRGNSSTAGEDTTGKKKRAKRSLSHVDIAEDEQDPELEPCTRGVGPRKEDRLSLLEKKILSIERSLLHQNFGPRTSRISRVS